MPPREARGQERRFLTTPTRVCALSFSPDGGTLAAGMYDGKCFNEDFHNLIRDLRQTVSFFDANTGARIATLDPVHHSGPYPGLASTPLGQFLCFSPDGSTLA